MADTPSLEQTAVLAPGATAFDDGIVLDDLILDEWDFEEISIDGICGVY
jgi:mycofactocin precursor